MFMSDFCVSSILNVLWLLEATKDLNKIHSTTCQFWLTQYKTGGNGSNSLKVILTEEGTSLRLVRPGEILPGGANPCLGLDCGFFMHTWSDPSKEAMDIIDTYIGTGQGVAISAWTGFHMCLFPDGYVKQNKIGKSA